MGFLRHHLLEIKASSLHPFKEKTRSVTGRWELRNDKNLHNTELQTVDLLLFYRLIIEVVMQHIVSGSNSQLLNLFY